MSYFQEHHEKLALRVKEQEDKPGLRECQIGAFWATCAHFTASNSPALIVMPTGSGKTAVMMLLAFGLRASRVLVISPAVVLRDQTARKFASLDDLIKAKALPKNIGKPKVYVQEARITSKELWNALREYDVVVATPHTTSQGYHREIIKPPEDLFDIVFFDEAHHARAPSWDILLKDFEKSKCILLTATPFRLDKRALPGHLVYYYPMSRAIDRGIYRPIEYHPVKAPSLGDWNRLLCEKAKELLTKEKNNSRRTKLLIRTSRVHKSKSLITLYKSQGILVDEVNYRKSLRENQAVLNAIKQDKLDGVICVGMLGEGLDIPELKIAVLHDPPKSFPFTLQFIGRVSRPAHGQVGSAHVIANPEQIRAKNVGEIMRRLYHQDESWHQLVPKLVEEIVGPILRYNQTLLRDSVRGVVNPRDIAPFFSARLYNVKPDDLNLNESLDLGKVKILSDFLIDENFRGLITESAAPPPWGTKLDLELRDYNLHLYYYHRRSETLFESTTSDAIAAQIRKQIINGKPKRCSGEELIRAMQSRETVHYLMVGLANVLGRSPSLPTYKILMGTEVEGTLKPTDGRAFTPGHALAKISKEETRGIASFQGRVWAIKRASLMEYRDWCDSIGDLIVKHKSATSYPGLGFSTSGKRVNKIPDQPIAVLFNYCALGYHLTLVSIDSKPLSVEMSSPEFKLKKFSKDGRTLSAILYPNASHEGIPLVYNVTGNQWTVKKRAIYKVKVDSGHQVSEFTLEDFLIEYPPHIYLGNGGVLINGELYQPKRLFNALPDACFLKETDWSNCDITVELKAQDKFPEVGKLAIHDWLKEKLKIETGEDAIILKDHGTGEIADFIVVEPRERTIRFYHCKRSSRKAPGARLEDLKVLEQAYRSILWIGKPNLLSEIASRATSKNRPNSKLIKGTVKMVKRLAKRFQPSAWTYQVIIVQPGLDCKKAVKKQNTNTLLLACYEWLHSSGASLLIMGY